MKTRPGADCGSNNELLVSKFRLKLKKIGKTARPFRHDLNQHSYDYTVEVTNRFKGLDLIDRMLEELWMEVHNIRQDAVIKASPKKKKCEDGYFEALVCHFLSLLAPQLKSLPCPSTSFLRFIGLSCSEKRKLELGNNSLLSGFTEGTARMD